MIIFLSSVILYIIAFSYSGVYTKDIQDELLLEEYFEKGVISLTIAIFTHILSFIFSVIIAAKEKSKFWTIISIGFFFQPIFVLIIIGILFTSNSLKNKNNLLFKAKKLKDEGKSEKISELVKNAKNYKELQKIDELLEEIIRNQEK